MLNSIVLMGRLVADPELRSTPSGVAVCAFTIAVDRDYNGPNGQKQTDFIDIVAWRQTAEFVSRYFSKGRMIVVKGSLQSRKWQDKNGNNRVAWEVQTESVWFGDSKPESGGQSYRQSAPPQYQEPYHGTGSAQYRQPAQTNQPPLQTQLGGYFSGSDSDFTPLPDDDLPF